MTQLTTDGCLLGQTTYRTCDECGTVCTNTKKVIKMITVLDGDKVFTYTAKKHICMRCIEIMIEKDREYRTEPIW